MNLLLQPPGSRLCGQYCVAMAAGVEPAESIAVFGSKGPTKLPAVVNALRHFGLQVSSQLHRVSQCQPLPNLCLLKVGRPGVAAFHWVLFQADTIYCPVLGVSGFEEYPPLANGFRFTSFLEIIAPLTPPTHD